MEPQIRELEEKKLVGMHLSMSLANNRTPELWKSFMPRRREIDAAKNNEMYSLQVHPPAYFERFDPAAEFEKWALAEVKAFDTLPAGMEAFILPAGLYAVFQYKGMSSDTRIFQYIFSTWLPASEYALDKRPHFEVLGERYKNNDPDSEEEIWIPVKKK